MKSFQVRSLQTATNVRNLTDTKTDASCGQGSGFYTCGFGDTFLGCCKSNPCASPSATCSQNDLAPAFMDQPYMFDGYVRNESAAKPSNSPNSTPEPSKKSNTGAIVGGVVGGVLGLALIGVLVFFLMRRKKRSQATDGMDASNAAMTPMQMHNDKSHGTPLTPFGGQSPPPTYSAPHDTYQAISSPTKDVYAHYGANNDNFDGPQELPASDPSPREHRFSELPAAESNSIGHHRMSELPAGASEIQPMHSSPRQHQAGFTNDMAKNSGEVSGLGVSMDEGSRR
ncbi:hypothetical protein NX059_005263 [Plenodomus lindquistii]|nr:hypothetical protein NX059_005263 [Plenodomus lindquistii]